MFEMNGMEAFTILFEAVAVFALVLIGVVVVRIGLQSRATESSPLLSVDAMVVSHRARRRGDRPGMDRSSYFVTFEMASGERLELQVGGQDFDRLAEGDRGHLMHQGMRYKGFTRQGAVDGTR